jgi:hypothetical protein
MTFIGNLLYPCNLCNPWSDGIAEFNTNVRWVLLFRLLANSCE